MIKKAFRGWIAVAAVLGSAGVAVASAAELRQIGLSNAGEAVQVTLDLSSATTHQVFTLEHPDRVVIDLRNTHLASGTRIPEGAGIVSAVRTGARPRGGLRIVLELKIPAPARAQWVSQAGTGNRLVVAVGKGDITQLAAGTSPAAPTTPVAVRAAHAPADSDRDIIVAVDAGHGGEDPGAIGRSGTREKDVVLAVARALAVRINAESGMHAVLTRDRDQFLVLRERIRRARVAKADL